MTAFPPPDGLDEIILRARLYAQRRWGQNIRYLKLVLEDGREQCEVVPLCPLPPAPPPPAAPPRPTAPWAAGPEPRHLPDWSAVYWPGLGTFRLTRKQGKVVEMLWTAWEEGDPEVAQAELLRAAESDSTRLQDLFRRGSAWGQLVLVGEKSGTYRLPDLDRDYEAA